MKWINSWCVLAARRTVFLWLFHRVNKMFAPPTKKIWNSNVVEQLSGTILRSPCERKIEKSALLFVGCRHGVRRESNSIIIIISLQVSWYSFSGIFKLISWYDILFYYFGSFFSAGRSMLFRRGDAERRDPHLSVRFYLFCNALCKVYDAIVVMNAVPWPRPLLLSIDYVYIGE